ncbi:hypothetical protein R1flu_027403 [Riccia fluitans]|uniref:Uncharacterized protein n=1 Tax=Riccia fluitans TaxID=41844 RepID=A0ABD1XJ78_9MARC
MGESAVPRVQTKISEQNSFDSATRHNKKIIALHCPFAEGKFTMMWLLGPSDADVRQAGAEEQPMDGWRNGPDRTFSQWKYADPLRQARADEYCLQSSRTICDRDPDKTGHFAIGSTVQ